MFAAMPFGILLSIFASYFAPLPCKIGGLVLAQAAIFLQNGGPHDCKIKNGRLHSDFARNKRKVRDKIGQ